MGSRFGDIAARNRFRLEAPGSMIGELTLSAVFAAAHELAISGAVSHGLEQSSRLTLNEHTTQLAQIAEFGFIAICTLEPLWLRESVFIPGLGLASAYDTGRQPIQAVIGLLAQHPTIDSNADRHRLVAVIGVSGDHLAGVGQKVRTNRSKASYSYRVVLPTGSV